MSDPTVTIEAGIQATNYAFELAFAKGDAAAAAAAVDSATGQALPPNGATVSGRKALQAFWQAVMDMGVKSVTLETIELESCGEIVYEVGRGPSMGSEPKCWTSPSISLSGSRKTASGNGIAIFGTATVQPRRRMRPLSSNAMSGHSGSLCASNNVQISSSASWIAYRRCSL